jgi:hypothetical protein
MIDLKSCMAGVAKKSSASPNSATGMSSPGGEETDEGELTSGGRQSAVTMNSDFWILNSEFFPGASLELGAWDLELSSSLRLCSLVPLR